MGRWISYVLAEQMVVKNFNLVVVAVRSKNGIIGVASQIYSECRLCDRVVTSCSKLRKINVHLRFLPTPLLTLFSHSSPMVAPPP